MSEEEFIKQRCEIDKITEEEFEKRYRVVKCNCGQPYCKGYRCLDLDGLLKENQELKSQLKGTTHCYDEEEHEKLKKQLEELKSTNKVLSEKLTKDKILKQDCLTTCCGIPIGDIPKLINQQKKFIEYLENEIDICDSFLDTINLQETPYRVISSNKKYITTQIKENEISHKVYEEILQKYKEIIGDDK